MLKGTGTAQGQSVTFNNVTATSYTLRQKAGVYVVGDCPLGTWFVGYDTVNLTTKVYANPAGTLVAVALA